MWRAVPHAASLILCALALSSCLTTADLRLVEESLTRLDEKVSSKAPAEEVRAEIAKTKAEVKAVADNADARNDGFWDSLCSLPGGGVAGAISAAAMLALNVYRNRTRRRDLVAVNAPRGRPHGAR